MTQVHSRGDLLKYRTPRLLVFSANGEVFYATKDGRYSVTRVSGGYHVREKINGEMKFKEFVKTLKEAKESCGIFVAPKKRPDKKGLRGRKPSDRNK